eukprot:CAMPEP_0116059472 /NCGR_PEP_ID=MMETSP0322-20121206/5811_1 /TAXON_ID=163516 /ORGANISM="Leptocylindrus danicus var. apora, Strain B651" /LENGTH=572 /DNA_ID=CAMNT_0003543849 /DNA_START=134 /DNA_END=1852 /DNA_ORIENTATION=-
MEENLKGPQNQVTKNDDNIYSNVKDSTRSGHHLNGSGKVPRFVSSIRVPKFEAKSRLRNGLQKKSLNFFTNRSSKLIFVFAVGLVIVLCSSFVYVILIERKHVEGHHLHPHSNVLRDSLKNFNPKRDDDRISRKKSNLDEVPILIKQTTKIIATRSSEKNFLIRRKLDRRPPNMKSFPKLQFQPMILTLDGEKSRDTGDLVIRPVKNFVKGRKVQEDEHALMGHVWKANEINSKYMDSYYAFDDDVVRARHLHGKCRRTLWHKYYFPNCNQFHELDLAHDDSKKLGSGYYRTVWAVKDDQQQKFVLKGSKYKHPIKTDFFENVRMDALVMERLTSSPRIVDMFGHCALGVITEQLDYDMETTVIPTSGTVDDEDGLKDQYDVNPQNDYKPTEKLGLALEMAKSIAELHGFQDGVIVHDDIQLSQFLIDSNGKLKLNDFNRAEVMLFDEEKGQYCRYRNGGVYGNYRAPEEFKDSRLNEKIDVWSMGNNIYALLTGLWVYYETDDDKAIHKRAIDRELSYIDPRYRTRSFAEGKLVEIMERCWKYDPDERADIFEVVDFLQKAVEENKRRKKQ